MSGRRDGWRLFERDNAGGGVPSNSDPNKLSRGGLGNLDDVPASTFIDPRPPAISMREPRFLWRRPRIVWTKTKALFGPQ
jgi:hypothetical protein